MITKNSIDLGKLVRRMPTPPPAKAPWIEFVRFKPLPATDETGEYVLVEAYDFVGNRAHSFTVPWRYDVEYRDHCEAIARMILDNVSGWFQAGDWRYYV